MRSAPSARWMRYSIVLERLWVGRELAANDALRRTAIVGMCEGDGALGRHVQVAGLQPAMR